MATDLLMLGGYVFTDFSPPEAMPFGGKHTLGVHKLPGGSRVIDKLGPDDDDITWSGTMFSDNAYADALFLDALRSSGAEVPLIFGGQFLMVVVSSFQPKIKRFPMYVDYSITCTISLNPMSAIGGLVASVDQMISGDISAAMSLL